IDSLCELLGLERAPTRIECFDISHTMGEATVASCVVFDTEGAVRSQYRRYNIAGIEPGDDYAAMQQALTRRFRRAAEAREPAPAPPPELPSSSESDVPSDRESDSHSNRESACHSDRREESPAQPSSTRQSQHSEQSPQPADAPPRSPAEPKPAGILPDLLLIDGGAGQVAQARGVLASLGIEASTRAGSPGVIIVGVAKGEERRAGHERLLLPDGRELRPGADSPGLQLIQQVRDEAHRFAITGHRGRRQKARSVSRLEDIPGIGPRR